MSTIKEIYIVGKYEEESLKVLEEFKSEFGEYIDKVPFSYEVILKNGIHILAVSDKDLAQYINIDRNKIAIYGADRFMNICRMKIKRRV